MFSRPSGATAQFNFGPEGAHRKGPPIHGCHVPDFFYNCLDSQNRPLGNPAKTPANGISISLFSGSISKEKATNFGCNEGNTAIPSTSALTRDLQQQKK